MSSVSGILQARILEWVVILFSRVFFSFSTLPPKYVFALEKAICINAVALFSVIALAAHFIWSLISHHMTEMARLAFQESSSPVNNIFILSLV